MVTLELIAAELRNFLGTQVLSPDVTFSDNEVLADLGLDSFSLMEMVLFAERRFNLKIPVEKLTPDAAKTVRSMSELVHGIAMGNAPLAAASGE